jgi:hypothetical protein
MVTPSFSDSKQGRRGIIRRSMGYSRRMATWRAMSGGERNGGDDVGQICYKNHEVPASIFIVQHLAPEATEEALLRRL